MAVNLDKIKAAYEREQGMNSTFWNPKDGPNLIRLLPPVGKDNDSFYEEVYTHFVPGEAPISCLKPKGKPCPLCDKVEELRMSEIPEDLDAATRLSTKRRILYYVVDLNDAEAGAQAFSSGPTVFRQLLTFFADPEWGDLTDPEKGYDLIIERQGKGKQTRYQVRPKKNPSSMPPVNLENLAPLKSLARVVSPEEVNVKIKTMDFRNWANTGSDSNGAPSVSAEKVNEVIQNKKETSPEEKKPKVDISDPKYANLLKELGIKPEDVAQN